MERSSGTVGIPAVSESGPLARDLEMVRYVDAEESACRRREYFQIVRPQVK